MTHMLCGIKLGMDKAKYQQYKREETTIIFYCKNCIEEQGREYTGHVDVYMPRSSNALIEFDAINESPIKDALGNYIAPHLPTLVEYSLTSDDSSVSL